MSQRMEGTRAGPPAEGRRGGLLTWSNLVLALLGVIAIAITVYWIRESRSSQSLAEQYDQALADSNRVLAALQQNDAPGASNIFFEHIHNLIHQEDFDLRQRDPTLGQATYDTMLAIEA